MTWVAVGSKRYCSRPIAQTFYAHTCQLRYPLEIILEVLRQIAFCYMYSLTAPDVGLGTARPLYENESKYIATPMVLFQRSLVA